MASASDTPDFLISVALSFVGGSFDPEALTARIGLEPTLSGRVGDPTTFGAPRRRDQWAIRVGPRDALDLEEMLVTLFAQLRPGWEQIKQAAQDLGLELVVGFVVEIRTDTGPIAHFTAPVLAQLADLGAALDVDLLVRRPRPAADDG